MVGDEMGTVQNRGRACEKPKDQLGRFVLAAYGASWIFSPVCNFFKHTFLNSMSLAGCRAWCPTDFQHLCCKALINKIMSIRFHKKYFKMISHSIGFLWIYVNT